MRILSDVSWFRQDATRPNDVGYLSNEKATIQMRMTLRLCDFVQRICSDNSIKIIKENKEFNSC